MQIHNLIEFLEIHKSLIIMLIIFPFYFQYFANFS